MVSWFDFISLSALSWERLHHVQYLRWYRQPILHRSFRQFLLSKFVGIIQNLHQNCLTWVRPPPPNLKKMRFWFEWAQGLSSVLLNISCLCVCVCMKVHTQEWHFLMHNKWRGGDYYNHSNYFPNNHTFFLQLGHQLPGSQTSACNPEHCKGLQRLFGVTVRHITYNKVIIWFSLN